MYDAGIYMLRSKRTGDSYVGLSLWVECRIASHLSKIKNRCHPLRRLRAAFRNHRPEDIETLILERCSVVIRERGRSYVYAEGYPELLERERYWITTLQPSLNKCKNGRDRGLVRKYIAPRDSRPDMSQASA